jgi:uncharacterized membrane protein
MDKLITPGRNIYAAGILALGIVCIISKDFIVGRPPAWPAGLVVNPGLAYISGSGLILLAVMILIKKKAGLAALLIAVLILPLSILRHLPNFMNDWGNAYKSLALFGGTLIVACSYFKEDGQITPRFKIDERWRKRLVLTGCFLLGAFFIAMGYAHFKFAAFVIDFIPAYIPFHAFWTYFCGVCLFAGGVGLLLPQTRKWAALLSGIMVFGWFILLHIPRFIVNPNDPSDRMGLCESFTFAGIFFVLAGMVSKKE